MMMEKGRSGVQLGPGAMVGSLGLFSLGWGNGSPWGTVQEPTQGFPCSPGPDTVPGSTTGLQGTDEHTCLHCLAAADMPVVDNDGGMREGVLPCAWQPVRGGWPFCCSWLCLVVSCSPGSLLGGVQECSGVVPTGQCAPSLPRANLCSVHS